MLRTRHRFVLAIATAGTLLVSLAAASAPTGLVLVTSFPLGAPIVLDRANTGKVTPALLTVPFGSHTVTVQPGDGWIAETRTVEVSAVPKYVSVTLVPALTAGPAGPAGPKGDPGPSGIASLITVDRAGEILPQNFPELRMVSGASTLVQVAPGQRLMVRADLELQPSPLDPSGVALVHLTIGHRPTDGSASEPVYTLPVGPPIGLPGSYNRLQSVHGLITGLPAGEHEVGIAGLSYPAPGDGTVTVHRVRMTVVVVNP